MITVYTSHSALTPTQRAQVLSSSVLKDADIERFFYIIDPAGKVTSWVIAEMVLADPLAHTTLSPLYVRYYITPSNRQATIYKRHPEGMPEPFGYGNEIANVFQLPDYSKETTLMAPRLTWWGSTPSSTATDAAHLIDSLQLAQVIADHWNLLTGVRLPVADWEIAEREAMVDERIDSAVSAHIAELEAYAASIPEYGEE
jgi:hypothetical protein